MSLADALNNGRRKRAEAPAPAATSSDPDRVERARAYLQKMPEAISGSGGHVATFNAARKLADFGLSEGEIFRVLKNDYNPRCQPAWSDSELRHKASEGFHKREIVRPMEDRAPRPRAVNDDGEVIENVRHAAHEPPPDPYADAPDMPPDETSTIVDTAPEEKNGGPGPTADDPLRGLKALSAVALLGGERIQTIAATAVIYAWQDIAVAGTVVLIAGPPAEGKTTLLFLILAARLNTGEPVSLLGRRIEPATTGKWVVLIEGEHSEASTSRKLVKSLRLLGVDASALDRVIIVARKAVRLGSPEWLDIVFLCGKGLVSDIAIDTVARVAPADANNEQEQVAIFDQVAQAIEKAPDDDHKPIVWAVSHTRKNGTDGGLGDVSGSAQRTGQADSVLMIKGEKVDGRTVSTTVTFAKLREDPDEYPLPVTFSIKKDEQGTPRMHVVDAGSLQKVDDRPLEARIVDALRVEPRTQHALKDTLKRSWQDIGDALTNLFAEKAIRTTYVTIGGRERKAFELRDSTIGRATTGGSHPADEFDDVFEKGTGTP